MAMNQQAANTQSYDNRQNAYNPGKVSENLYLCSSCQMLRARVITFFFWKWCRHVSALIAFNIRSVSTGAQVKIMPYTNDIQTLLPYISDMRESEPHPGDIQH